jgi:alpha-glucosidase
MQWRPGPGAGFSDPGVEPWLPIGNADTRNVEAQERDPASTLNLTRELIRLRSSTDLGKGPFRTVLREDGVWVWRRGALTVAANLTGEPREISVEASRVLVSSSHSRDRGTATGTTRLEPWEGLVLEPT